MRPTVLEAAYQHSETVRTLGIFCLDTLGFAPEEDCSSSRESRGSQSRESQTLPALLRCSRLLQSSLVVEE